MDNSIGLGVILGKNFAIEASVNHQVSDLEIDIELEQEQDNLDNYKKEITKSSLLNIDYDSRDDALLTTKGALINLKMFDSQYNEINYQSTIFDFDLFNIKADWTVNDSG